MTTGASTDQTGDPLGHVPQVASLKGISFFDIDDLAHFEADLAAGYTARYTFIGRLWRHRARHLPER